MRRLALFAALISGGQAMACMPENMPASDVPTRGPACSISYTVGGPTTVGLGQAQDLGQGFVLQSAYSGTGCSGETHMIVSDCNKGQSVALGTYSWAVMEYVPEPTRLAQLNNAIAATAKTPGADVLRAAQDKAKSLGLTDVVHLRRNDRLNVDGKVLGVACACKSFYPGLTPGS